MKQSYLKYRSYGHGRIVAAILAPTPWQLFVIFGTVGLIVGVLW